MLMSVAEWMVSVVGALVVIAIMGLLGLAAAWVILVIPLCLTVGAALSARDFIAGRRKSNQGNPP